MSVPPRGRSGFEGSTAHGGTAAGAGPVSRAFDLTVNDMAFSETGWYAATERGLLVSGDSGKTWSALTAGAAGTAPLQSVCLGAQGNRLWIATTQDVAESNDGGVSWAWHPLPRSAGDVLQLRVAESQGGADEIVLAETRTGLYISRDSGGTWRATGSGLPQAPLSDLAVAGPVFFAAMQMEGLYVSRDEGESWNAVPTGSIQGLFPAFAAPAGGAMVYVASATEGVYLIDWKPAAGSASESDKP